MSTDVFRLYIILIIKIITQVAATNHDLIRNKSTTDLIKDAGYPVEVHHVTTTDGYRITLHRIPNTHAKEKVTIPLLLVHGLSVDGSMFVAPLTTKTKGLAFILSNAGYDIWILHVRGTHLSMKHKKFTPADKQYWDFSWHEIGIYDVTATIDHILQKTGVKKIHYAGVSQGTTVFLVALSMLPKYNKKVESAYLMVPPGSVSYPRGLAKFLLDSGLAEAILELSHELRLYVLPLRNERLRSFVYVFCQNPIRFILCEEFANFNFGNFNRSLNTYKLLRVALSYVFDNASVKQFEHYIQLNKNRKFQQFDYGKVGNMERYNMRTPPEYNLSSIQVPITLMSGKYDNLATEEDVLLLKSKLKHVRHVRVDANHADFIIIPDVVKKVKDDMLSFMGGY